MNIVFLMIIMNQSIFEGKNRVCERVKPVLYRLNDLQVKMSKLKYLKVHFFFLL